MRTTQSLSSTALAIALAGALVIGCSLGSLGATSDQYAKLGQWLLGARTSPSQVWAASNCSLYRGVNQCTNQSDSCKHTGVDYVGNKGVSRVHAVADGEVINVVHGCTERTSSCLSWVAIYHKAVDCTFLYLHLETIGVSVGQQVSTGDFIGTVGSRGYSTGPHLHFEARSGRQTRASLCVTSTLDPYETAYRARLSSSAEEAHRTATVLVMDVSGSMGWSWQGGRKIDSAKEAALRFIELVEQETKLKGTEHWVGVVGFSDGARLLLPLTDNYAQARHTIISLQATTSTNLGAGISTGLQELLKAGGNAQRYMTVLSDGMTNRGLNRDAIISGPVAQARSAGICINTVAYGDPGDIDEDFLRKITSRSGCGRYEYAATGFELFAAYVKIRHHALGQVISGLSSFGRHVIPIPGQPFSLGTISIPSGQQEMHITLGWSANGRLQLKLTDPSGRAVTSAYPGAILYSSASFSQAVIASPQAGIWRVDAQANALIPGGTEYFAIGSTRPGGIAFSLPLPVIEIGDFSFALPGWLPTWAVVAVSLLCIAAGIYQILLDAGLL